MTVIRHLKRPRSCYLNPFPPPARAYLGHWTRFRSWAQEHGLDLPGGLEAALCDYLVRLAEDGKRMATIRQAWAAIIRGADLAGWPRSGGSSVASIRGGHFFPDRPTDFLFHGILRSPCIDFAVDLQNPQKATTLCPCLPAICIPR